MGYISRDGVALHYRYSPMHRGPGDGPTLVFANSLGTDLRLWDDVALRLEPHATVLRYDKRGHGLSGAPQGDYTIDDHVSDLAALLDALSIERSIVVGLSVGGMIAMALAALRPDLVRALVLCDTGHRIGEESLWNARIAKVTAQGMPGMADAILERWFTPAFFERSPPELGGCRSMLLAQPAAGYAGTCAAIRDADLEAEARAIAVPTLCLGGDADLSTPPELMRDLAALIPDARFEVIQDCGHIPPVEQPDALLAHLEEFLDAIEGGAR